MSEYRANSSNQLGLDVMEQWRNFGALAQLAEPIWKGALRCNLELTALASRRAQAYLALPTTVQSCRSPQDLASEHMRFWQVAAAHYAESGKSIMEAWNGALSAGLRATESAAQVERDYFKFTESRAEAEAAEARKQGTRRAA